MQLPLSGISFDTESGLAYNRFRYYAPEEGMYISQDPIRLRSGEANLYSYVSDVTLSADVFGLETCKLTEKEKRELKDMYPDDGMTRPNDHHIVRENAPSNWDETRRNYILDSQKILGDNGIGLNDDIRNFTRAENGNGAHTKAAAKHVWEQLDKSKDVIATLTELAEDMNKGTFF